MRVSVVARESAGSMEVKPPTPERDIRENTPESATHTPDWVKIAFILGVIAGIVAGYIYFVR